MATDENWHCEGAGPCLGMGELCVCRADENQPPVSSTTSTAPSTNSTAVHETAKKKLKLQLQKPHFERMNEENMATICKGYV